MSKKYLLYSALIALPLIGAQCIQFNQGTGVGDGGIFKSINSGAEWKQKTAIPTVTGTPRSFASADIVALAQDPSDRMAIYAGTKTNGMFYSYDGGESWRQPAKIAAGVVNAVAVDPKDKCNIYAATANTVLKSTDCNRSFAEAYRDQGEVTALVIDNYNSANLYIGTATGAVLKSHDAGRTWSALKNFGGRIVDIAVNPTDTRIVYVAVAKRGLWKSVNAGLEWIDLSEGYKKLTGSLEIRRLVLSRFAPDTLITASKYGLIRSQDGGASWTPMTLLTKPGSVEIYSLAINPKNADSIYYATASTFYSSQDGGASWATKKLPTSRAATYLLIDGVDPSTLYMGVTKIEK